MGDKQLPSFEDFKKQYLGRGARFQEALTWQDTYLEYLCRAMDIQINGAPAPQDGTPPPDNNNPPDNLHPAAGFTELIDPRLDNWHYFTKPFTNISVSANGVYSLYPYQIDEWGTVLVTAVRMSSPDCRLTVKAYSADGQYMDINNTARELLALGRITAPTGLGFDLNIYNDTLNLYAFELRAPWPGLPFYKKIEIWLNNETANAVTLFSATVTLVKLDK